MPPLDLPKAYNGCRENLTVEHVLSLPNGGLVLIRHDVSAKERGALGAQGMPPSSIYYKPCINSSMVQGGRTGLVARITEGEAQYDAATGV